MNSYGGKGCLNRCSSSFDEMDDVFEDDQLDEGDEDFEDDEDFEGDEDIGGDDEDILSPW